MQIFANVGSEVVRKTTKSTGKAYWEFRAAESAKNEKKDEATWYTVRVFQDEDPDFSKGDFVRIVGKLKLDTFTGRDGTPKAVLVVMCYEAKKYVKAAVSNATQAPAPAAGDNEACFEKRSPKEVAPAASGSPEAMEDDERWLALVA